MIPKTEIRYKSCFMNGVILLYFSFCFFLLRA